MMRRPPRATTARLLAALFAFALLSVACAPPPPARSKPAQQLFRDALVTGGQPNLPILDPALVSDTGSHEVVNLLYDGLVTLTSQLQVEPWGAARWDISPDGLTYTFHLRPGQFFADGAPVHASDYAFAINRALHPCLSSPVAYYLWPLKDGATFSNQTCRDGAIQPPPGQRGPVLTTLLGDSILPDDAANTLTLILAHPTGAFLAALTYPTASALEPRVVGSALSSEQWTTTLSQGTTGQGTSGMYYLASQDHTTGKLVLKQNPHWWGRGQNTGPFLTEIDFTPFQDAAAEYAAYLAGQVDVGYPPTSALAQAKTRLDEREVPTLEMLYLILNWRTPPFDSLDARQAFCLAVDRQALNAHVYANAWLPTTGLVPQGVPGFPHNPTSPAGTTDNPATIPVLARQHWQTYEQSLYRQSIPSVTYAYIYAFDPHAQTPESQAGQELQQQWQSVLGVRVAIQPISGQILDPETLLYNSQIALLDWTMDYPDPQDALSLLFLPDAYGYGHADVPEAFSLLRQADAQAPSASRLGWYQEAEGLLVSQVAACPLLQAVAHYTVAPSVYGWSLAATGFPADDTWRAAYFTAH